MSRPTLAGHSLTGGTKEQELNRSAKLFEEILSRQGMYFALMFLIDSGYGREEIKAIAERFKPALRGPKEKVIHGVNCFCPAAFCCGEDD
jgi:hypothetical protein